MVEQLLWPWFIKKVSTDHRATVSVTGNGLLLYIYMHSLSKAVCSISICNWRIYKPKKKYFLYNMRDMRGSSRE